MTSAQTVAAADDETGISFLSEALPLHVLTLTPFYPSEHDPAQGCFVSEPLREFKGENVINDVIAVRPFYRGRARAVQSDASSRWHSFFPLPGNIGLPLSGDFLAASLRPQVRKLHRRQPFDLIHAHSALPCGAAALSLSKKLSIPFVVTVHGLDAYSTRQAGPRIGKWCEGISKQVYESAAVVICISEKVRQHVAAGADVRASVVYNGIDPCLFHPCREEKSSLIVLSVGNLIPIKGHALLLRAFARVANSVPGCSLEIIGDGPERSDLAYLARGLRIRDRVRFLGRQSRQEVAAAMQRCALFALPSSYEGLGCVYLEAMACGKPAIGCSGQGIEEIIEHEINGVLVSPGSETELSDALTMLLSSQPLRQRMGNAGYETVRSRHTIAHQAVQLTEIYRECAR
jgi:glycosyltransferase involved in cell wall biosynthesis